LLNKGFIGRVYRQQGRGYLWALNGQKPPTGRDHMGSGKYIELTGVKEGEPEGGELKEISIKEKSRESRDKNENTGAKGRKERKSGERGGHTRAHNSRNDRSEGELNFQTQT